LDRRDQLIVAVDTETYDDAARLIEQLAGHLDWYKIGSKLFTREGPRICDLVKQAGGKLFLDLKYHDIPNTVHGAVTSAMELDVSMLTLHASGGPDMLIKAREAVEEAGKPDVILVAVTVLTSFNADAFVSQFGSDRTPEDMVVALATIARESGMNGVVASARELRTIKERVGRDFIVVTPGIRLPDAGKDDQTRVVTPEAAILDGSDYLVVGRPIIAAPDPAAACKAIIDRMNTA
jgi:orotidine-5'-phosphate decarboxylase